MNIYLPSLFLHRPTVIPPAYHCYFTNRINSVVHFCYFAMYICHCYSSTVRPLFLHRPTVISQTSSVQLFNLFISLYISAIVIPPPSDRYSSAVPPLFLLPCSSTFVPPLLFHHPALFKRLLSVRRQRVATHFQYTGTPNFLINRWHVNHSLMIKFNLSDILSWCAWWVLRVTPTIDWRFTADLECGIIAGWIQSLIFKLIVTSFSSIWNRSPWAGVHVWPARSKKKEADGIAKLGAPILRPRLCDLMHQDQVVQGVGRDPTQSQMLVARKLAPSQSGGGRGCPPPFPKSPFIFPFQNFPR